MRLIDADVLKIEIDDKWMPDMMVSEIWGVIDEAPTVATGINVPNKWISVKDRLPETQNPVIVYVPPHTNDECESYIGYVGMAYYTDFGNGFWGGTDGNVYGAIGIIHSPTHWMPLPEPPME